ncbi:MAG TPA: hypothetical protein VN957_00650, partial [Chthoniobacterales bacterium]|nr:hypothetical protein [Chthoniobacterales bacterium]
ILAGVFRSLLAAAQAKWTAAGQSNQPDRAGANENPETSAVFALRSALPVLRAKPSGKIQQAGQEPLSRAFAKNAEGAGHKRKCHEGDLPILMLWRKAQESTYIDATVIAVHGDLVKLELRLELRPDKRRRSWRTYIIRFPGDGLDRDDIHDITDYDL